MGKEVTRSDIGALTSFVTSFDRLQELHPGRFPDDQRRTLQRRVRQWRHMMAKQLIYKTVKT